jgi:hypothetical protein
MATYSVSVVNPRRKKKATKRRRKKTAKRKTKKKTAKRKVKRKAKKTAKRKTAKRRGKKKATKRKAKKKTSKRRGKKKAAKRKVKRKAKKKATKKRGKKKATKRRAKKKTVKRRKKTAAKRKVKRKTKRKTKRKKNPGYHWSQKEGKWWLMRGARKLAGPYTSHQMDVVRSGAKKAGVPVHVYATEIAKKTKAPAKRKRRAAASTKRVTGTKRMTKDVQEAKVAAKEAAKEVAQVATAWQALKAKLKRAGALVGSQKKEIAALEKALRSCKNRLGRARKRGDLTAAEEGRLKDRLDRCRDDLKTCKTAKKAAPKKKTRKKAAKKTTRRKTPAKRKARKRPARRAPAWPSNVPRPGFPGVPEVMTVEKAIERLSVAGRNMGRFAGQGEGSGAGRGATASGRRMQMASAGYLQLNPMVDIPGHPGLAAQFKSTKSRKARAVAAKTPRSVKPRGSKKVKEMSARERQAILRRALRGT